MKNFKDLSNVVQAIEKWKPRLGLQGVDFIVDGIDRSSREDFGKEVTATLDIPSRGECTLCVYRDPSGILDLDEVALVSMMLTQKLFFEGLTGYRLRKSMSDTVAAQALVALYWEYESGQREWELANK
jgi:hypothetical protein